MKVYFATRFSIYDPRFTGFRLSRYSGQQDYEERLFDKARLEHKFDTFEMITLPSILGQTHPDWEWTIYTSDRLPQAYMARLRGLVKSHSSISLTTAGGFEEFFERDKAHDCERSFATVRLDDDDGLNECFVQKLQQYSECVGSIVSFTEGRLVKCVGGRVVPGKAISERNNAQGMAGIGLRIYQCGRHSDIDTRHQVIYDSTPDMFFLTCSPFTDTHRAFTALGRIVVKCRRVLFLMLNHPGDVPKELAGPLQKILRHRSRKTILSDSPPRNKV